MQGELTHKDLAKRLGVSVTTIKSYRARFPGAFLALGRGKPLRFGPEALDACRAIRQGFQRGLSIDEIYQSLIKDFPGVEADRRLSDGGDLSGVPGGAAGTDGETNRRLERLEAMLAELVALGNRTHSLHVELLAKLDALAGLPGVVRAAARTADADAGGGDTGAGAIPPDDFLSLPVVVLSDRGEFLGITVPGGTAFRLREFETHLVRRAGRMDTGVTYQAAWSPRGEGYVLTLLGGERRTALGASGHVPGAESGHEHFFRPTTTPKGNLVALFHRLRINGKDVSEAFLRAFFKQIKDSLE